tara:strand:+ start:431 stop:1450 length:1020 start_codon:yes stop_codon:yes gene_type:complete
MSPILYQDFKIIEANDIIIHKSLVINDSSGQKIFWIDKNGCSIKVMDKVVELEDVIGFPKLKDGVLCVNNNKIDFLKNVNLDDVCIENLAVKKLEVKDLKIDNINVASLITDSLLNKQLTSDEAKITNIKTDKLISKDIITNSITTDKLDIKVFEPTEIKTEIIVSKNISVEEGKIDIFQSNHSGISKLECENIMSNCLDVIEIANIKVLNAEKCNIDSLNVCNAKISILKVDKLVKNMEVYGSVNDPLILNMVNKPFFDCSNQECSIKIFNKIVENTPQNRFELINLADGDYNVITKCHNQLLNVVYNICQIDGKKFLFTKFIEKPKDLILEIIIERI